MGRYTHATDGMERQTDVQIDSRGRLTIPNGIREQLGIEDHSADVRLNIEVLDTHE